MATTEPPQGGDLDRGPAIMAVFWTEAAVAVTALALRLYGRRLVKGFGVDDYIMTFTILLFINMVAFAQYLAVIGAARHMYYLTTTQQLLVVKYEWIAQTFGVLGFATSKTSVALQIRRILGPNSRRTRWLLWLIISLTCTICGIDYIFGFVQCTPPRAMWEPWIPHKCWDPRVQTAFSLFFSVWNIFIDLVLATIPMPIIWHAQLSVKQRVAACALLGLGPLAAACGIVKITYVVRLRSRSDLTWSSLDSSIWSTSELFVTIVCGCIPPMRPVFVHHFGSKKQRFQGYLHSPSAYGSSQRHIHHQFLILRSFILSRRPGEEDTEALRSWTRTGGG
ncbi:integral membrane protein [Aspergillus uvarum CBS 121591]|uniref:Integral membrane protein n=1 Tax=Aspergillus uvarum CBS 121591 TaxID=1448315 RepID=A0A319BXN8_9EURO|nr:integral membrane protein [Aspergillus uvarum CBS 121591]PYH77001.1 integral membrane protein [Aspergillus uvarum CBS 121591]